MTIPVSIIVTQEKNNGIGFNGDLLFRIKRDMDYFKDTTSNVSQPYLRNAVIWVGKLGYRYHQSFALWKKDKM